MKERDGVHCCLMTIWHRLASFRVTFFRGGSHEKKSEGSMADQESTKKSWVLFIVHVDVVKLPPPPPTIS